VNLVDLNGRRDEPDVLGVLEQSHGSAAALEEARAHYRSGEWLLLGWQDGYEVLAGAGAEKYDADTIGIRSIAVVPSRRNKGLAHPLVDALSERMDAERVVAETDDDAIGFYRRCGFSVQDAPPKFGRRRYWCVRDPAE
jgi:ribosomal protein S18 acetylase RimI-like enzyme